MKDITNTILKMVEYQFTKELSFFDTFVSRKRVSVVYGNIPYTHYIVLKKGRKIDDYLLEIEYDDEKSKCTVYRMSDYKGILHRVLLEDIIKEVSEKYPKVLFCVYYNSGTRIINLYF